MDASETKRNMKEEQMEMMEKSFQMASRYMPVTNGTPAGAEPGTATATTGTATNVSGKTAVIPVSQVREQTVSSLAEGLAFARLKRTGRFMPTLSQYGATERHQLLPVPASVMNSNPNIEQSPGWF
jgi:hypothetical protein